MDARAVLQAGVPGQGRRARGQPEQDRPGVLLRPARRAARRPAAEDRAAPHELIFLYEDLSGTRIRVIPTDGRAHRTDANPSYYGDSVGKWEGDALVIDVRNFVEDTWFGEKGYFHTDALRVTERLWLDGDNLVWQATVHDPACSLPRGRWRRE